MRSFSFSYACSTRAASDRTRLRCFGGSAKSSSAGACISPPHQDRSCFPGSLASPPWCHSPNHHCLYCCFSFPFPLSDSFYRAQSSHPRCLENMSFKENRPLEVTVDRGTPVHIHVSRGGTPTATAAGTSRGFHPTETRSANFHVCPLLSSSGRTQPTLSSLGRSPRSWQTLAHAPARITIAPTSRQTE